MIPHIPPPPAATLFVKITDISYTISAMITYLGKLGELTLKGSNIKEFEKRLVHNTQLYLENVDEKSGCSQADSTLMRTTAPHKRWNLR